MCDRALVVVALKSRPSSGRAPSTSNRFEETIAYWTFSGSQSAAAHPPVTLNRESLNDVHTAIDWNDFARARTSRKFGSDSGQLRHARSPAGAPRRGRDFPASGNGSGPEQRGVDDAEDRRVRADAEGEGGDDDGGERSVLEQRADGEA